MKKEEFRNNTNIFQETLNELKSCQREKEQILQRIEILRANNMLEANQDEIKQWMSKKLAHFEEVVAKLKQFKR